MTRSRDILYGVVAALIAALAVGILAIRVEAIQTGVTVDWGNQIDGITEVGNPWLQHLAIAIVCGLVLYPLLSGSRTKNTWEGPVTLAVVLILLAVWAHATADYSSGEGIAEMYKLGSGARMEGNAIITWLRFGGLNPAIHATAVASALIGVLAFGNQEKTRKE
ncbi:hypothetical protein [Ancrocorticia populi]|uniref:Uncharacterized protein n=1 Tax=Ancrocorticia populi TaxID=2175228 RepID=A0A2V1K5C9_9ACTO|nr:hypothetical protein [Ancrocorticia populi]MDN6486301.1 hypothetical protein [Ancrocorticia sp.]PWF25780.1 hypothetical protein DD236_10100 [Ancrocorticia populi]